MPFPCGTGAHVKSIKSMKEVPGQIRKIRCQYLRYQQQMTWHCGMYSGWFIWKRLPTAWTSSLKIRRRMCPEASVSAVLPLINSHRNTDAGLMLRNAFGDMNGSLLDSIYGVRETIQYRQSWYAGSHDGHRGHDELFRSDSRALIAVQQSDADHRLRKPGAVRSGRKTSRS